MSVIPMVSVRTRSVPTCVTALAITSITLFRHMASWTPLGMRLISTTTVRTLTSAPPSQPMRLGCPVNCLIAVFSDIFSRNTLICSFPTYTLLISVLLILPVSTNRDLMTAHVMSSSPKMVSIQLWVTYSCRSRLTKH